MWPLELKAESYYKSFFYTGYLQNHLMHVTSMREWWKTLAEGINMKIYSQ